MAQTGTISNSYVVGGISFSGKLTETGEGGLSQIVTLPAGISGVMATTKTEVTGLVTLHGLSTGDFVNIHWTDPTDGVTHKVHRGLQLTADDTNDVTWVGTADGDALPDDGTAVVIAEQVPIVMAPIGNDILMLAMKSTQRAIVDYEDGGTSKFVHKFDDADDVWSWDTSSGFTNPLAGDTPDQALATNGSVTEATLYIGILLNSVA